MRHFRYLLPCFALAAFSPHVSAQTVEDLRCDTDTLHALFSASVKETRKLLHGDMEPNLVSVTALPATMASKRDSCLMQCEAFLEWPKAWTDSLGLTTVPLDSTVDQRVFIKRPTFRSAKTCIVPYHITPSEWGGWSGFLEFRKRGQHWRFKRNRTTGVSCGSW
ncbi:MAG: hypothetical protein IPN85_04080 [Flavobacteriales bacterium]|nr:hypothetical protein [Flavobacteriales bacterium]MBL0036148.1 hypothetical protein [Flavobacteriales bacterium]